MANRWGNSHRLHFWGLQNHCKWWLKQLSMHSHTILNHRKSHTSSNSGPMFEWASIWIVGISSVQFSCSVVSDSLQPHESQHTRPACPSPMPGVHSNSCPSSWWCHPAISSSVVPFSSCLQSLSASESFPMSQLFAWGCQSTGVSALALFLPKNTQGWPPLGRWKIQEMDDSESCTTMWMYLVSLNYTVKYG